MSKKVTGRYPERLLNLSALGRTNDPYKVFVQLVPFLTDQIRAFRHDDASDVGNGHWHSYRGFSVLAGGLVVNQEENSSALIATGNLRRNGKSKVCAEKRMLGRLNDEPFTQLTGLVIAATTDPIEIEEVLGKAHKTLLPCVDCTDLLTNEARLVQDDMPIVTVGLEEDTFQTTTPAELHDFYTGGEMLPIAYRPVGSLEHWEHRISLYDMWSEQRRVDPPGQPNNALLARAAIGIQPDKVFDAFEMSSREVPILLTS